MTVNFCSEANMFCTLCSTSTVFIRAKLQTCEMQSEWTKSSSRWLFMQGLVNTIYDMKIIWNQPFFKERVGVPTKDKLLLRIYLLVCQNIRNWPKSKLNFYTSLSHIILWQWICWTDSKTICKVSWPKPWHWNFLLTFAWQWHLLLLFCVLF